MENENTLQDLLTKLEGKQSEYNVLEAIKEKIESIKQSIEIYKSNYIDIENLKNQFAKLYDQNASIEQKANFLSSILDPCNYFNNRLLNELEKITGLSFDSYDDVINTKDKLSATLEELEKNNSDGKNDPYIKDLKKKIEKIKSFKTWYINIDTDKIQYDFLESFNSKTSEAEKEVIRNNIATLLSNDSINFELNNQEDSKKKKKKREKLKKETKRKLKQKDDEVKRSKKPLIIIGAVALVTTITIATISNWQSITDFFGFNKNNDDNDKEKCPSSSMAELPENELESPEITPTPEPTSAPSSVPSTEPTSTPDSNQNNSSTPENDESNKIPENSEMNKKKLILYKINLYQDIRKSLLQAIEISQTPEKKLVKIGYSLNSATAIVQNFNEEELNKLIDSPFNIAVENYAHIKDVKIEYINDYEEIRNKYNFTSTETVDYVNRAYLIKATHFFEDAKIHEIVDVLISVHNKDIYNNQTIGLKQSIYDGLNLISDKHLSNAITNDDILKIQALRYFYQEGTDMDKFLEKLIGIETKILQGDKDATNEMYSYLSIFTRSLNDFENRKDVLTDNPTFNDDAIVTDYLDWLSAYEIIISPLMPTFSNENNFDKFFELRQVMKTALQTPEFQAICGQSRTLEVN